MRSGSSGCKLPDWIFRKRAVELLLSARNILEEAVTLYNFSLPGAAELCLTRIMVRQLAMFHRSASPANTTTWLFHMAVAAVSIYEMRSGE